MKKTTQNQTEQTTAIQTAEKVGGITRAKGQTAAKDHANAKPKSKATNKPSTTKGEKKMKATGTKTKASKPAIASINEAGTHFELLVPAIKKGDKVGEWSVMASDKEKKPLAIPTKTVEKNIMLVDVQRAILDNMKDKTQADINKLKKDKKEKPEKFTENNQLELDQKTALVKCLETQRKKYVSSKYNPRATLASAIMLNIALNIDVKPLVSNVRASWNDLLEVIEKLYKGESVTLTSEQQEQVTDIKKVIISIAIPYCATVKANKDGKEVVICEEFPLTLSNKDIFKLLISLYQFYKKDGKGNMTDGLKLDGKEEKALKINVQNLIYARMTGAK